MVIRERLRSQVSEARRQRLVRGHAASLISAQSCARTATATPQLTCGAREALTSRCASTSAILYSGRHRSTASQLGIRRRTCAARIVEIEVRAVASRAAHSKSAVTPCLTVLIFFGSKIKKYSILSCGLCETFLGIVGKCNDFPLLSCRSDEG